MAKNLVIVESPAKAKTINKYLGKDFTVKASMGHVRDLPKNPKRKGKGIVGGVDTAKGFTVDYEVLPNKKKALDDLKAAAEKADAIYLAADPDREGEAICWHLAEELDAAVTKKRAKARKMHRVVFNEITKRAIEEAFKNPGVVDAKKVDAQQARRVLDRLVGYAVSPILWDKVRRGLSAGRVQSVALKLICDREREIRAFKSEEYWTVLAHLEAAQPPVFPANLLKREGKSLEIGNGEEAALVREHLEAAAFQVDKVTARERRRNPVPPFITSKLQQESFQQAGLRRAQDHAGGPAALRGRRARHRGRRGSHHLHAHGLHPGLGRCLDRGARAHRGDLRRGLHPREAQRLQGQEGRPGRPRGDPPHLPRPRPREDEEAPREGRAAALHPHLEPLRGLPDAARGLRRDGGGHRGHSQGGEGKAQRRLPAPRQGLHPQVQGLPGRLRRGEGGEGRAEAHRPAEGAPGADDQAADDAATQLPPLAEGDSLALKKLDTDQHFTQPPPRFSEASLVKALEENGIGRPSTYASIISTIEAREYTEKRDAKLHPTELGFVVIDQLVQHFQDIINVEYTAAMEEELDEIEEGTDNFLNTLNKFWKKFKVDLDKAKAEMKDIKRLEEKTDEVCDKCC